MYYNYSQALVPYYVPPNINQNPRLTPVVNPDFFNCSTFDFCFCKNVKFKMNFVLLFRLFSVL